MAGRFTPRFRPAPEAPGVSRATRESLQHAFTCDVLCFAYLEHRDAGESALWWELEASAKAAGPSVSGPLTVLRYFAQFGDSPRQLRRAFALRD